MYYPYIRGKQFELLALKDLIHLLEENKEKISPIIEPVRDSWTLKTVLNLLKKNDINFNFIINPWVWDLCENIDVTLQILIDTLKWYNNYQIWILIEPNLSSYYSEIAEKIEKSKITFKWYSLIHNSVNKDIDDILSVIISQKEITNNIINLSKTNSDRRYSRKFGNWTKVTLDDYFKGQDRNADYWKIDESPFSTEYLYYKEEWNKGFWDFLTIWDSYTEWWFRPYAVAIHISYKKEDEEIFIKHFVSDSNWDPSNIAGKFTEANRKLVEWIKNESIPETFWIKELQSLNDSWHFPWLWVLKKLSIMNHIELVLKLMK